jgi:phosphoribosyl-ATP pyrophosphohydrolase/phosphoribosyl-AMP cyclohydrolase
MDIAKFFEKAELIPVVVQEARTGEVLMLAYMSKDSLRKTLETGYTWFFSRSRGRLWQKGEESGHVQRVVSITGDCDDDTLLVRVEQTGPACHTGARTCFFAEPIYGTDRDGAYMPDLLKDLYEIVETRRAEREEGSYTAYLFDSGIDKILKKLGEECSETIIAAKNLTAANAAGAGNAEAASSAGSPDSKENTAAGFAANPGQGADQHMETARAEMLGEIGDLLYHLTVLMAETGIRAEEVAALLRGRMAKTGNLKQSRQTDRNT